MDLFALGYHYLEPTIPATPSDYLADEALPGVTLERVRSGLTVEGHDTVLTKTRISRRESREPLIRTQDGAGRTSLYGHQGSDEESFDNPFCDPDAPDDEWGGRGGGEATGDLALRPATSKNDHPVRVTVQPSTTTTSLREFVLPTLKKPSPPKALLKRTLTSARSPLPLSQSDKSRSSLYTFIFPRATYCDVRLWQSKLLLQELPTFFSVDQGKPPNSGKKKWEFEPLVVLQKIGYGGQDDTKEELMRHHAWMRQTVLGFVSLARREAEVWEWGLEMGWANGKRPGFLGAGKKKKDKSFKKGTKGKKNTELGEDAQGVLLGKNGVERSLACAEHAVRRLREYYEMIGFDVGGHDFLESCERRMETVRGKVGVVAKVFT